MGDWQPIDTAPRDGSEVLLAITGTEQGRWWVHVGFWREGDSFPWRFIDDFSMEPAGCCEDENEDRVRVNGAKEASVTHWMSLPPPPQMEGK